MKRFLTLIFTLCLFVAMTAQIRPVLTTYSTTVEGHGDTDTITLNLMTELDYLSLQFVPTYGAILTDSLDFSWAAWMRNTYTGAWTRVTYPDTVHGTSAAEASADIDGTYFFAPWKYLQLRCLIRGTGHDTVTVTLNALQKK